MRRLPQHYPNPHLRRERDPRILRRQSRLLAACLVLAVGFVVAAREQITKIHLGYQVEALRNEREALLDEQRRLLLELERRSSPANLERAARDLGLQPARPAQIRASSFIESAPERKAAVGMTTGAAAIHR